MKHQSSHKTGTLQSARPSHVNEEQQLNKRCWTLFFGSFHLISSYISYYSHRFLFFFTPVVRKKKGSGANSIQHAYRFDTLNLHFVAVLFACVSSSILPIKSWNNFQSKKQQGAALFSSVSESHYLNHSLDPFSQFFPNTLIYWNNAVLLF